ncbi:MAG: cyclopropane-fatty-acyl-phospholipid synthase family protein [Acidimicrobiia bacterium]|nr:cyclopropane-fatty-acyl-phospholipid synthase family protein [Acidimicrobiia bacterium]
MSALTSRFLSPLVRRGTLHVTTPGGRELHLGSGPPEASLEVRDRRAVWRLLRGGTLGFAEAYLDGLVDTPDLESFLRWGAENVEAWARGRTARLVAPLRAGWQRLVRERRHPRVETMVDHYNLGNDFYTAWLDETVTYSSGRFARPGLSLAEAQRAKYRAICQHAGLRPGMRVLEIGCGWGGFAAFAAAEYDVEVTGLTVAEEQAVFARARLAEEGLADRTRILLEDFRDHAGVYDAVVSIEMIESIDETVWPDLFEAFAGRVDPGGAVVMQAIVIDDDLYAGYRRRRDFIQRYVFPGGQLPSPAVISALADDAGLRIDHVETFGEDYARTLDHWRRRFRAAWPGLAGAGLDERLRRLWELYLGYCEAGFRIGRIDVGQWVLRPAG